MTTQSGTGALVSPRSQTPNDLTSATPCKPGQYGLFQGGEGPIQVPIVAWGSDRTPLVEDLDGLLVPAARCAGYGTFTGRFTSDRSRWTVPVWSVAGTTLEARRR